MTFKEIIDFFRVYKWYKNILLFVPSLLEFGLYGTLNNVTLGIAFILFSLTSSGLYIYNDIADRNRDKLHPTKKNRLITSGKINLTLAILIASFLIIVPGMLAYNMSTIIFAYIISDVIYNTITRRIPILDCGHISLNAVIRVLFGYSIIGISPNITLLGAVFFFTMITSLSKRAREYIETEGKVEHRDLFRGMSVENTQVLGNIMLILFSLSLVELYITNYIGLLVVTSLSLIALLIQVYLYHNPLMAGSFKVLIKNKYMLILLSCLIISAIVEGVIL